MKRVYVEEIFEHKGYKCACVFNAGGYRCGYVAIDESHPYYKKDYSDEGPNEIMCHWGLTYSGYGKHFCEDNDNLWWFGFDCGHYCDGTDYETAKKYGIITDTEYLIGKEFSAELSDSLDENIFVKTQEFVEENCKMVVEQLIAVKKKGD